LSKGAVAVLVKKMAVTSLLFTQKQLLQKNLWQSFFVNQALKLLAPGKQEWMEYIFKKYNNL